MRQVVGSKELPTENVSLARSSLVKLSRRGADAVPGYGTRNETKSNLSEMDAEVRSKKLKECLVMYTSSGDRVSSTRCENNDSTPQLGQRQYPSL